MSLRLRIRRNYLLNDSRNKRRPDARIPGRPIGYQRRVVNTPIIRPSFGSIDNDNLGDDVNYDEYDNQADFSNIGDESQAEDYSDLPDDSGYNRHQTNNDKDIAQRNEQKQVSPSKTTSPLAQMENDSTKQKSASRDIGQQERAGYRTNNFNKTTATKAMMSGGFKRGLLISGIALLSVGGFFVAQFTILSGPLQLVQAMSFIKDFMTNEVDSQISSRSYRNNHSFSNLLNGGSSFSDNIRRSRISALGNFVADKQEKRLKAAGMEFKSGLFGSNGGAVIDYDKVVGITGDASSPGVRKQMTNYAKSMGLDDADFKINGKNIEISEKISPKKMRQVVYKLDDIGKWDLIGAIQSRSLVKRAGFISAFHPFQRKEAAAIKNLDDFVKKSRVLKKFADKIDAGKGKMTRALTDKADDSLAHDVDLSALSKIAGKVNIVQDIVDAVCMFNSLASAIGPYKMQNIVNVAIAGSNLIQGYGSQVQSGDDINLDLAGYAVEQTMGDKIDVQDSKGNPVKDDKGKNKQEYSSFWNAAPVRAELGYNTTGSKDDVPETLLNAQKGGLAIFGDENSPLNVVFTTLFKNPLVNAACFAVSVVEKPINDIMDKVTDTIVTPMLEFLHLNSLIAKFATKASDMVMGVPLDLATSTPKDFGSIGSYGGKFSSDLKSVVNGGKKLSSRQSYELKQENREFLAWRNDQKPLLARLFDPADYNSTISQIAILSNIDTSDQKLTTQIGNLFKAFTATPTIISQAVGNIAGGNAYAASNYDYGADTYAYSSNEMSTINNPDNAQYDMFNNADGVIAKLKNEDDNPLLPQTYHNYASQCLGVDISKDDYSVKQKDNEDGKAWNYVDVANNPICQGNGPLDLRTYIMDYNSALSSACYEGGKDDSISDQACKDSGFNGSSDSSIDSSGNTSAADWKKKFNQEAPGGSWNGYSACPGSNGCTTLSKWMIEAHTDLKYGNGNGNQVVSQLVNANPDKNLTITNAPTKAPALFSSDPPAMAAIYPEYGHVGLVTAINPDGSVETLETGTGTCDATIQTRPKSAWLNLNVRFVYIGDHIK